MPYQSGENWIGNPQGRMTLEEKISKPTKKQLRDRELLLLLRKLRPHLAESVLTASRIMESTVAKDADKLKAAAIILDYYRKLVIDLYETQNAEEEGQEIQAQNKPAFSLKLINKDNEVQIIPHESQKNEDDDEDEVPVRQTQDVEDAIIK